MTSRLASDHYGKVFLCSTPNVRNCDTSHSLHSNLGETAERFAKRVAFAMSETASHEYPYSRLHDEDDSLFKLSPEYRMNLINVEPPSVFDWDDDEFRFRVGKNGAFHQVKYGHKPSLKEDNERSFPEGFYSGDVLVEVTSKCGIGYKYVDVEEGKYRAIGKVGIPDCSCVVTFVWYSKSSGTFHDFERAVVDCIVVNNVLYAGEEVPLDLSESEQLEYADSLFG